MSPPLLQALTQLLEPLLDEDVRRRLAMRRALEEGDVGAAAALEAGSSRRGQLLAALRRAVDEERYGEAAELSLELRVETSRRADVTQDEGGYDRYLDQDDWYARGLAAERERELQKERERAAEREAAAEAVAEAAAEAEEAEEAEEAARVARERREAEMAAAEEAEAAAERLVAEEAAASAEAKAAVLAEEAAGGFRFDVVSAPRGAEETGSWSDALEGRVFEQMLAAFDNYPPEEVEALLAALVRAAGDGEAEAERSLLKLAGLARSIEALPTAGSGGDGALAADEARSLYSQVRMWGKDGERWLEGRGGRDSGGSWLGWLNDLRRGL